MAKILPGPLASKISGTIAGTTFQNWRGLLVARMKSTPTNVNSPRQTVIRAIMTLLSRAWRDDLTAGLRVAWNQRAAAFPWLDVFGNERKMTGENLYIKQNMVLLDHFRLRQDTPVPNVVPSELVDMVISSTEERLILSYNQLSAGEITSQEPFLDIRVAGGFTTVDIDVGVSVLTEIGSQCLPQGRKHQTSDFRHCAYSDDVVLSDPVELNSVAVAPPDGTVRNVVIVVQRFNKFGNFTQPRLFNAIVVGA